MNGLLALIAAYLIGGIPFGFLLVRLTTGKDVRAEGSGNIGATNVLRTTGRAVAVATLVLDIAKGYFAVWLMAELAGDDPMWLSAAALAVMAGHAYPVSLKFKGGKAVASFIGAFLYLTPLPLFAVLLVFVAVVAATRHISAGSIIAAAAFPFGVWMISTPACFGAGRIRDCRGVYRVPAPREYRSSARGNGERIRLESKMRLGILGAGSWGTALAVVLAPRFERITLWVFEADLAERMLATRQNDIYLPGIELPANVEVTAQLQSATGAGIVLGVMPSHHARRLYGEAMPFLAESTIFVSATKGLEQGTLLRMSQVILDVAPFPAKVAVLSGPTFAREVARGDPTAVVIASESADVAAEVQGSFSGPTFRLYTNFDTIGVEIAAAVKNVIAIGAGVCQGLGLGNNSLAALITRGLAEITRLAVAMGGQPKTLAGLAGLGDLVLTCSGVLSRNRMVGIELAKGRALADIVGSTRMVAEGVETCGAAVELGVKFGVDLPIVTQMHAVLHAGKNPREALRDLMERSLKGE